VARLSYLQPDAGNCGGITGWLEAVQLAREKAVALCGHGMQELHVSLLSGQAGGGWLGVHSFPIDRDTTRPLRPHDHRALAPDAPGTGVEFDWARLEAAAQQTGSAG
jgi:L-alanine-DL-glutamate epimerase-like enolase superfamily enzyme